MKLRLRQLDRALGPLAAAHVVSHLRVTGQYPHYAARAQAKAQVLGLTGGDSEVDAPTRFRLAVWYFEHRLGGRMPDDLDEYAASCGFADTDALYRALWREYRYLTAGAGGEPGGIGEGGERAYRGLTDALSDTHRDAANGDPVQAVPAIPRPRGVPGARDRMGFLRAGDDRARSLR